MRNFNIKFNISLQIRICRKYKVKRKKLHINNLQIVKDVY